MRIFVLILSLFLLASCSEPTQIEKDAAEAAELMCETMRLVNAIQTDEEAIAELELFQQQNEFRVREITASYDIQTEDGAEFTRLLSKNLEKCKFD